MVETWSLRPEDLTVAASLRHVMGQARMERPPRLPYPDTPVAREDTW